MLQKHWLAALALAKMCCCCVCCVCCCYLKMLVLKRCHWPIFVPDVGQGLILSTNWSTLSLNLKPLFQQLKTAWQISTRCTNLRICYFSSGHFKHLVVLSFSTCSYNISLISFSKKWQWCTFQFSKATSANFLCQCHTLLFFWASRKPLHNFLPWSALIFTHDPSFYFLPVSLSLSLSLPVSAVS